MVDDGGHVASRFLSTLDCAATAGSVELNRTSTRPVPTGTPAGTLIKTCVPPVVKQVCGLDKGALFNDGNWIADEDEDEDEDDEDEE
jgi:hypothetical protein